MPSGGRIYRLRARPGYNYVVLGHEVIVVRILAVRPWPSHCDHRLYAMSVLLRVCTPADSKNSLLSVVYDTTRRNHRFLIDSVLAGFLKHNRIDDGVVYTMERRRIHYPSATTYQRQRRI